MPCVTPRRCNGGTSMLLNNTHYGGGGANLTDEEIEKAKKKYEIFDTSVIPKIFKDVLDLQVESFAKPKSWGLPHVIYIVKLKGHEDLVLRANLGPKKPEIILLIEKLITEKVTKIGIKTSEIVHLDISRKKYPFDFQIQKKFGGLDPEIIFKGSQKDYDKISFQIGETIAKMSEIKFEKFGRFDENQALKGNLIGTKTTNFDYIKVELNDNLKKIVDSNLLSSEKSNKIMRIFEESKNIININQGSLVHYDLADHNLRYDPKTYNLRVIFDWEASVSSDPFLDIASSPTWKTIYPREQKILEGYLSLKRLPDNYKEKINIYRLRTVIWKIVHNIKFNILNKERIAKFANALACYKINL